MFSSRWPLPIRTFLLASLIAGVRLKRGVGEFIQIYNSEFRLFSLSTTKDCGMYFSNSYCFLSVHLWHKSELKFKPAGAQGRGGIWAQRSLSLKSQTFQGFTNCGEVVCCKLQQDKMSWLNFFCLAATSPKRALIQIL